MPADLPFVATLAALIEFGGALIIGVAVVRALVGLAGGTSIGQARLIMIAGSLSALGYKSAATLLKAIELGSWHGIGSFAAIFTLRTVIKQLLDWERKRLLPTSRPADTAQQPVAAVTSAAVNTRP